MQYVYTVTSQGWDNLRPPAVVSNSENVKYVCFTDTPNLPNVGPWQYRPLIDLGHPSRTNRLPKILPHLMLPTDAEYSVYHDANFQLTRLPEHLIECLLDRHDWAAHKHPARDCIYEECDVLLSERIGTRELVEKQVARYREEGYPKHAGLWANGLLVRRHTGAVKQLCEDWWKEFSAGCERDQVSFPVARRRTVLEVNTLNGTIYESQFMNFWWHAAWKDRPCNFDFVPERKRIAANLGRIYELTGKSIHFPVHE